MSYISIKNMTKVYGSGQTAVVANDDISFDVDYKDLALIVGQSGAGKSTVLNILGGMDNPTSGQVIVDGKDIANFNAKELTTYRRYDIGFVFQNYNLIPNLTALENVEMSAEIAEDPLDSAEVLESVGLGHRMDNFPSELSGGEQQRVAIARALVKQPKLILADEPTGALDSETGRQVLELLQDSISAYDATVVIITHNSLIAPIADRVIRMKDAKIEAIETNDQPVAVSEIDW